jgi:CO dehydrogenase nickel-insertion accessory protein CooC1
MPKKSKEAPLHKVIIVGTGGVGKSVCGCVLLSRLFVSVVLV